MVLPSGETSSETQVPSSVVNSIVRFDLSGRAGGFFLGSSFFSLSFGSCFSFLFFLLLVLLLRRGGHHLAP